MHKITLGIEYMYISGAHQGVTHYMGTPGVQLPDFWATIGVF